MQFIDIIPYVTMILSIFAITIQYISFIKLKNMDNIPYSGLMGMLLIGILNYFYMSNKNLPLIPVYSNIIIATVFIITKISFNETNIIKS